MCNHLGFLPFSRSNVPVRIDELLNNNDLRNGWNVIGFKSRFCWFLCLSLIWCQPRNHFSFQVLNMYNGETIIIRFLYQIKFFWICKVCPNVKEDSSYLGSVLSPGMFPSNWTQQKFLDVMERVGFCWPTKQFESRYCYLLTKWMVRGQRKSLFKPGRFWGRDNNTYLTMQRKWTV